METTTAPAPSAPVLARIMAAKPANAQALIVAELEEDESDSMTDYYGSRTIRRVAIGWRTGSREDFRQLRRAAATFPETAHLAPGCEEWTVRIFREDDRGPDTYTPSTAFHPAGNPSGIFPTEEAARAAVEAERGKDTQDGICIRHHGYRLDSKSVEHRDNHSMGKGNWLGLDRHSGWCVVSCPLPLSGYRAESLEYGLPEASAPVAAASAPVAGSPSGCEITQHHHTKHGFDMWIVSPMARLGEDQFRALRASCEMAGGWYSRKWGTSPGGFAFKDAAKAQAWAAEAFGGTPPTTPTDPAPDAGEPQDAPAPAKPPTNPAVNPDLAARLRGMADTIAERVGQLRGPRLENTPKRRRQGMSARCDAANLERAERALRALADGWEAGTLRVAFRALTTRKQIEPMTAKQLESSGYYDIHESPNWRDDSKLAQDLREYVKAWESGDHKEADAARAKAEELRKLEGEARAYDIPGFFPTPPSVVERMLSGLSEGCTLLDPSAGIGSILDGFAAAYPGLTIDGFEIVPKLAEICQRKGHNVTCADFLEQPAPEEDRRYSCVAMNPPFERKQAWAHIRHAWGFVSLGGRLVSVAPANVPDDFREWVEELGGTIEPLPDGAFKGADAFRQTGVACALVEIVRE